MSKKAIRLLVDAQATAGRKTGVGYYTHGLLNALAAHYPGKLTITAYYYNFLGLTATTPPVIPGVRWRPIYHIPRVLVNLLRRFSVEIPVELLTFTRADFALYPNFLSQPSMFKTPSATVIHDVTYLDLPEYVSPRNLHDLRRSIPGHIRRSSWAITVSEFAKRRIHQAFHTPDEDILVTLIPPERPRLISGTEQKAILADLGITKPYFLTLSTVEPRKNVLSALDAFLVLSEALQRQYTLVITGMIGWNCEAEVARLKRLKDAGKNVIHVGYVTEEQRAALYSGATFYTSASHYEGFGMTPLEAMSYGKACALSDIPVFREVAGNAAVYFDQNKPHSIAATWRTLLTNEAQRSKLANTGKQRAESFDWNSVATDVYNRIVQTLEQKS